MKKISTVLLILCYVVLALSPIAYASDKKPMSPVEFTNTMIQERCSETGGEWTIFADGCADTCFRIERDNPSCPRIFRKSCECGADKCWDTGVVACVPNESVKKR